MQNYSAHSEDELVQLLQMGDEGAFTEIFNRYWEKLLAVGYYYTQNKQAAEDMVLEVMTSLWTRKNDLTIRSISAYLGTAVKFAVFKSIIRNKKRRQLLAGQNLPEQYTDIEEKLDSKFLEEYLHGAVAQLPEKTRLVFTYSREQELSISEIAQKVDLSPKAVEYHISKALRSLRKGLKKIKIYFI